MRIIGLCGGSGSGKTTVAKLFLGCGFEYVNADEVYHDLLSRKSDCYKELISEFGEDILDSDGAIDRKRLGKIVFAYGADEKLRRLNEISHYYVLAEIDKIASQKSSDSNLLVDAPLLFESGLSEKCHSIIAVIADKKVRIERIMARDGIDFNSAEMRISKQIDDDFLKKNADFIIVNNGNPSELQAKVTEIAEKIKAH